MHHHDHMGHVASNDEFCSNFNRCFSGWCMGGGANCFKQRTWLQTAVGVHFSGTFVKELGERRLFFSI